MIAVEPGTVVWAPFPFVERKRVVPRPALVVARHRPVAEIDFVWCLMITNAAHAPWPGDVGIGEDEVAGLAGPSKVRTAKVAMFAPRVIEPMGRVSADTLCHVLAALRSALATGGAMQ